MSTLWNSKIPQNPYSLDNLCDGRTPRSGFWHTQPNTGSDWFPEWDSFGRRFHTIFHKAFPSLERFRSRHNDVRSELWQIMKEVGMIWQQQPIQCDPPLVVILGSKNCSPNEYHHRFQSHHTTCDAVNSRRAVYSRIDLCDGISKSILFEAGCDVATSSKLGDQIERAVSVWGILFSH